MFFVILTIRLQLDKLLSTGGDPTGGGVPCSVTQVWSIY